MTAAAGWLDGYVPRPRKSAPAPEPAKPVLPPLPRPVPAPREEPEDEYAVIYIPIRCPRARCRSKEVTCYKSAGLIRYHTCKRCGKRFKSIEQT